MQTVEHQSELPAITDPAIRDWVDARWRGVLDAGAEACFLLMEPAESPLPALWTVTGGADPAPPSLAVLAASFEYVVDHGTFYEIVILANDEAGLIVIVPTSARLDPAWRDCLRRAARPSDPITEAMPHHPPARSSDAASTASLSPASGPTGRPSAGTSPLGRAWSDHTPDGAPTAGTDPNTDGAATMSATTAAPSPSAPRFHLGRVVATPHALAVMKQHGVAPLSLLQRHVQGDWGDVSNDDANANREALQDGTRLLSSYPLGEGVTVWIITEADRASTTLLLPSEY